MYELSSVIGFQKYDTELDPEAQYKNLSAGEMFNSNLSRLIELGEM